MYVLVAFSGIAVCQYEPVTEQELVLMKDYGGPDLHFRILDCHMCFKAAGIMCHPQSYQHNVSAI